MLPDPAPIEPALLEEFPQFPEEFPAEADPFALTEPVVPAEPTVFTFRDEPLVPLIPSEPEVLPAAPVVPTEPEVLPFRLPLPEAPETLPEVPVVLEFTGPFPLAAPPVSPAVGLKVSFAPKVEAPPDVPTVPLTPDVPEVELVAPAAPETLPDALPVVPDALAFTGPFPLAAPPVSPAVGLNVSFAPIVDAPPEVPTVPAVFPDASVDPVVPDVFPVVPEVDVDPVVPSVVPDVVVPASVELPEPVPDVPVDPPEPDPVRVDEHAPMTPATRRAIVTFFKFFIILNLDVKTFFFI
jgi:hypothetical protein